MPELDVSSLSVREEGSVHANEAPMYTVYTVLCPLSHGVLFCFLSEGLVANYAAQYVAAVSAQLPVENVKHGLQNITNEGSKHSVQSLGVNYGQCCPKVAASPYRPNSPITQLSPSMTPSLGTKVEVFVDQSVRGRARTERGNTRGGATKKREISRTTLSINLHF